MTQKASDFRLYILKNKTAWNRKILNYYWITFFLSIVGSTLGHVLLHHGNTDYIKLYILTPSFIIFIALFSTEIFYHFSHKLEDYFIITIGSLLASTFIYIHSTIVILQSAYLLMIFISTSYFEIRKLFFCYVLNIGLILCIYFFNPIVQQTVTLQHLIGISIIFILSFIFFSDFIKRQQKIIEYLQNTMQSKQDLLIQNIVMEQVSKIDPLTGLYNHISFHEYLDILIEQAKQNNLPIHLAILDIDNFKKVNDQYGHCVGDLVLKRISKIIKESIPFNHFACRYGGEEFAIIFTDISLKEAHTISDKIRTTIQNFHHEELNHQSVTISIGLQSFTCAMDKKDLFERADSLLYVAKKSGKNMMVMHGE